MAQYDGLKELFLGQDPGSGSNPPPGYIYKWVEKVGASHVYRYKDSSGAVGDIGTSGGAVQSVNEGYGITVDNTDPINPVVSQKIFQWVLMAGHSNLPANGTESGFAYGHNSANDGATMLRAGKIVGMTVRVEPARTAGTATYIITKNNVNNNVAGQRVIIDGTTNGEGGIDTKSGLLIFPSSFPYAPGDQIEVRCITSGWSPTSSDSTVCLFMEDII